MRKEADEDIRNCIKPYIQKIIDAILQDVSKVSYAPQTDLLLRIIKNEQLSNVRRSYGEADGQNFSDRDLNQFIRQGRDKKIADDLKNNKDFLDVVLAIKRMNPTDRLNLYTKGLETYSPTWAQLGRIDPAGQTEAGQEAEKMIAKAIVDLTTELLLLSDEEIENLNK